MARRMDVGELFETAWFEKHHSLPIKEIPAHWPADYRAVVQRRIELIESDPNIGLIERPEYKRRWSMRPWDEMQRDALRDWLLDRFENRRFWQAARCFWTLIPTMPRLTVSPREGTSRLARRRSPL